MVQDTYRNHPRPSAFDRVRDEVVRLVSGRLADKSPNAIYETTGIKMSRKDKYEWLEGDLRTLSNNLRSCWPSA